MLLINHKKERAYKIIFCTLFPLLTLSISPFKYYQKHLFPSHQLKLSNHVKNPFC